MTHLAPPPNPPGRPDLLNAFSRILWDVCVVVGERTRPAGMTPVIPRALAALICARLFRLRARFFVLVETALAGKLKPIRPRAPRAAPVDAPKQPRAPTPMPRGAGWLAKLCPYTDWVTQRNLGPALAGMTRMLEDPTLHGLLASDSRFGRALRPLWRMLRTDQPPACLRLPPRPRRPRPPRPKPDTGRPIPRGVTRRDLERSRAMPPPPSSVDTPPGTPQPPPIQPPPIQPPPIQPPAIQWGTATDWTPTHLTLGRRVSVFDQIPRGWRTDTAGWSRRFGAG